MITPKLTIHCWALTLLWLLVLFIDTMPLASASHAKSIIREIDPVVLTGDKLSGLLGRGIENIRLFSYRSGRAELIPFQIDQKDANANWVWDRPLSANRVASDNATAVAHLSLNDELVFMAVDAGDRATPSDATMSANKLVEIEVKDPVNHTSAWVYAAYYESAPPPLTARRYMRYRAREQAVISPIYEFSYSQENIAVMDKLKLNGESIMDRTKIRGEVDWSVLFFTGTIEFNEDSVDAYMEGYIDGPVRTVTRTVDHIRLESGMTTPDVKCDHLYYKHHSEIPLLLSKLYPVDRISMLVTTDYRNAPFDRVHLEGIEAAVEIKISPSTANQLAAYADAKWMALDGSIGSVLSMVTQPEALNEYLSVTPYLFQDSLSSNPPEAYRGSSPEAGYRIRTLPGTPSGDYVLYVAYLLSNTPYQRGDEGKLLAMINTPLVASARLVE